MRMEKMPENITAKKKETSQTLGTARRRKRRAVPSALPSMRFRSRRRALQSKHPEENLQMKMECG